MAPHAVNDAINYQAVLADLEAKRAQLDSAIAAIRAIMGLRWRACRLCRPAHR